MDTGSTGAGPAATMGVDVHSRALRTLHEVTKRLHASLDLDETLEAIARGVTQAAGFELAAVNLRQPDGSFTVVSVFGPPEARAALMGTSASAQTWNLLVERAEQWGTLYFVDHRAEFPPEMFDWVPDRPEPLDPEAWHPYDCLFAPLTAPSGEWTGVLSVDLPLSGLRPDPAQCELLELFAEHAALAVLHAGMHASMRQSQLRLEYLASHDQLTDLPNRSAIEPWLAGLQDREDIEVGVLVIDLDGFKLVNDTAGHEAGDEVLRVVAERLRHCIRDADLLARTGGDEFVVATAGADVPGSLAAIRRRASETIRHPIVFAGREHEVGASIGSARGRPSRGFASLMAEADAEMYAEKRETHRREERLTRERPA